MNIAYALIFLFFSFHAICNDADGTTITGHATSATKFNEIIAGMPYTGGLYESGRRAAKDDLAIDGRIEDWWAELNATYTYNETLAMVAASFQTDYAWQWHQKTRWTAVGGAIIGTVGNTLLLLVLSQKSFSDVCFIYHRTLAIAGFFNVPYLFWDYFRSVDQFKHFWTKTQFGVLWHARMGHVFNDWVIAFADIVTLMSSFERVVALWLPLKFKSVNNKSVARSAIFGSFVLATILRGYKQMRYETFQRDDGSWGRRTREIWITHLETVDRAAGMTTMVLGGVALAFTILIILGLIKASKRRKNASTSEQAAKDWKRDVQLCILQGCLNVPMLIAMVMWGILALVLDSSMNTRVITNLASFEAVMNRYKLKIYGFYWRLPFNLSIIIAYQFNYYFYSLFSGRFQAGNRSFFGGEKATPTVTVTRSDGGTLKTKGNTTTAG